MTNLQFGLEHLLSGVAHSVSYHLSWLNILADQEGYCPSFVTVEGVKPRKIKPVVTKASDADETLPEPQLVDLTSLHNILITGIGGTGVITIGALIGMAAHLEGKGVSVLDMTGMSQKNGSVTSHVRVARDASQLKAQRIPAGEADLILGCDMLTAGAPDAIAKMHPGRTYALVNTFEQPTGAFAQDADWVFPTEQVRALISESVGDRSDFFDATTLATRLLGDAIAANLFMLGFAFQKGHIPLSSAALLKAIEINGVAVKSNQAAFKWGRKAAVDLADVTRAASWAFIQVMFALHYAHDYYAAACHGKPAGLEFPKDECPDYGDFFYFAAVIGTSGQTADVSFVSKPMRRIGALHCILAYLFNTTVLALLINIGASMF